MPMHHRNIEFPQGDYVAHKKEKAAKTWDSFERHVDKPIFHKINKDTKERNVSMRINLNNKNQKVNVKVGGGI